MKPLDIETAKLIVDFSGGQEALEDLGKDQLKGAVALHNMIADPEVGFGYLADEVGMGKTYIALGVVALMRYFNPSLRVLYICPSRNVQEKWIKEYKSFTQNNVRVSQFRIRTAEGKPAAPYVNCRNVSEMISMAAIGYYADFFVGKGSFSISLGDKTEILEERCRSIQHLLPAHEWDGIVGEKENVKDRYAEALNYILPTFDLVVIDEAHNFKHNAESSDRNRVLSKVLGFKGALQPRVVNALLLSATPYDRNINQIRNQLALVGKADLLPENVKNEDKKAITDKMSRFMVRRLNCIPVNGQPHTRNMYRQEHRFGETAEVKLEKDEQKLVTALVQKKVGERMTRSGANPAFQIGMMASFESYAQTAKAEPVQFDSDEPTSDQNDAQDRHVVSHIVNSYKEAGLGKTLPHPKMDAVSLQLFEKLFQQGKKQLVFVRRVKSVKELKDKLDDHYNAWLEAYINKQVENSSELQSVFRGLFDQYRKESLYKDTDISEGSFKEGQTGDAEDNQPPKNDTFFAWFFRGKLDPKAQDILKKLEKALPTPEALRKRLAAKNEPISLLLELNWARYIAEKDSISLLDLINLNKRSILEKAQKYIVGQLQDDKLDVYHACQLGFIEWYSNQPKRQYLQPLLKSLRSQQTPPIKKIAKDISLSDLEKNLLLDTFYTELHRVGLAQTLLPLQAQIYQKLEEYCWDEKLFDKLDVHCRLISLSLRTGHGIVDVYLSRVHQGGADLTAETRQAWMKDLVSSLKVQQASCQFSTYSELCALSDQLDLIIKVNIPDVFDEPKESRRTFISKNLNPVSPVIGATGETSGNRSPQARKFRMPGYPLALISTNVFQEGEDLHTFCDSVVHFGLSGSPVSIEQKTGRVDRVSSLVQRRIIGHKTAAKKTTKDDFIQVRFPYIKESIELLQVRQLCHNINDFVESLHELGEQVSDKQDIVPVESINDKSKIPPQILSFLKSPYEPQLHDIKDELLMRVVKAQGQKINGIIKDLELLIKYVGGENVFEDGFAIPNIESPKFRIRLDSAKSCGELLLIAEADDGLYQYIQDDFAKTMREKSWDTLHRTLASETATDCYKLTRNTEMLVGDSTVTQPDDIKHFFKRLSENFSSIRYSKPGSTAVNHFCKKIASDSSITLGDITLDTNVEFSAQNDHLELKFTFGKSRLARKHTIQLYETEGLCVFIGKALTSEHLDKFKRKGKITEKDKKIIEYTWIRNSHVDVVEFLLDPEGGISGRVLHPINSLNWEEFVFCVYILAVEADRLEYIVDQDDVL